MRTTQWRKASYSSGNNGACVEIHGGLDAVRDSKNPAGGVLRVDLTRLMADVKTGQIAR